MVEIKELRMQQATLLACEECNAQIVLVDGQYTCSACGLVQGISLHPPRIKYDENDPTNRHERTIHYAVHVPFQYTFVGKPSQCGCFRDANGTKLQDQGLIKRLKREQIRKTDADNLLYRNISILSRMCKLLNIGYGIFSSARHYFMEALKQVEQTGKYINRPNLSAICIYKALHELEMDHLVSWDRIKDIYNSNGHNIKNRTLNKIVKRFPTLFKFKPRSPSSLVPVYLSRASLKLNQKELLKLEQVAHRINDRLPTMSGKDPKGIAAGIIYHASKLLDIKITQKELANMSGVTEVTVRNRVQDIKKYLYSKKR